jgi:Mrp family chromosome partitioning ATPase
MRKDPGIIQRSLDRLREQQGLSEAEAALDAVSYRPQPVATEIDTFRPFSLDDLRATKRWPSLPVKDRFEELKVNFLGRFMEAPPQTVLFVGIGEGDGASTVAFSFANSLAEDGRAKILLVDGDLRPNGMGSGRALGWAGAGAEPSAPPGSDSDDELYPEMGPVDNLFILPSARDCREPVAFFQSNQFQEFLNLLCERFNFVVFDAPPLNSRPESFALCTKVDGVVLVLNAGQTRRRTALWAKKRIEELGGKVLGVVLNRTKYHIPKWLYKRI